MKTQNFGAVTDRTTTFLRALPLARYRLLHCYRLALKNYRENRENGTHQDNPKTPFPSAGFDALDIRDSDRKSSKDWPDKQGRYWWKITLRDGRIIEDFYWTEDKVRGWPDKSNKDRYWFIVHHKNGTKIEGFSQESDYQNGFPDKGKSYWYTLRFTDTHSPGIRQWMEEKDKNYIVRLAREKQAKQQPVKRQESQQQAARQQEKNSSQTTTYTQPQVPSAQKIQYAEALYSFNGESSGDLPFRDGDILEVLDTDDPSGWWKCQLKGKIGYVPTNFIRLLDDDVVKYKETGQLMPIKHEKQAKQQPEKRQESQQQAIMQQDKNSSQQTTYTQPQVPSASSGSAETLVFDPETGQLIPLTPQYEIEGRMLQSEKILESSTMLMKTQNFGVYIPQCPALEACHPLKLWLASNTLGFDPHFGTLSLPAAVSLKDYRENRENGTDQDSPKRHFPSADFHALCIKSSSSQGSDKWPDKQGRYWWKLTLNDERVIEDFYWTEDQVRGFPDKSNQDRYWFIVHHKNGTKMEGFSQEPDYNKGFPDKNKEYWHTIRFTDTHCPAIRQWMEEKDRNYLARLKREGEEEAQQSEPEEQKKRKEKAKAKAKVKETALPRSPLKAVSAKDTKALLALGKKEDTPWREVDRHGNNVFHIAAKKGSVRVLKQLIESVPLSLQKTLLRRMNDEGEMPHHIAAKAGKIEWIQALMPLDVDFTAKTEEGKTAEQLSVENGHAILAHVLGNMSQGRNEGFQPPPGYSSPTTFQAMYDFQPEAPGQLSVQKDDVLTVLQQNPDGWWHCQNRQGQQGWVPMNFLAPWQGRSKSDNTPSPEQTASSHGSESHSQESEGSTPKRPSKSGSRGSRVGLDEKGQGNVDLIIPNSDLVIGRELGKGTFGAVYQGNWHGTCVAIKKLLAQTLSKNVEEDFLHEAGLMMQLQHENVVRLYGVSLNPYGMVLEFMAKGSLDRVLHSTEPLSWQWRYTISLDVAKGLAFLHRKRVLHRDLKSLNVLLDEHDKAKLGDFGLSRIKTSSSQTGNVGMAGTMQWIAPELLMDTMGRYTPACDVYSYGMLLWELLSRQIPYSKISNRALIPVHVMQGKREEMPKNSPHILSTLTTQCWAHDAKERPRMATVVKTLQDNAVTDTTPERSPYASEPSPSILPLQGRMSGGGYQSSFQSGTMTGKVLPPTPGVRSGYAPSQFFQTPQPAMSHGYAPSFQPHGMPRRLLTPSGQYAGQPASAEGYASSQPFFQPPPQNTQSGYGYPAPFQGGGPLPQPPQNNHNASGSAPSGYGYAASGYEKKGQS